MAIWAQSRWHLCHSIHLSEYHWHITTETINIPIAQSFIMTNDSLWQHINPVIDRAHGGIFNVTPVMMAAPLIMWRYRTAVWNITDQRPVRLWSIMLKPTSPWWRHQIETFSALLAIYAWNKKQIKKHQSSASLAFVRGLHRGPVNSPHRWPVTQKMFPFDDVIMIQRHGGDYKIVAVPVK